MNEREKQTEKMETPVRRTKKVRNRSGHRVELVIEGRVCVFLPGGITEVPVDFDIPDGIGLYVR